MVRLYKSILDQLELHVIIQTYTLNYCNLGLSTLNQAKNILLNVKFEAKSYNFIDLTKMSNSVNFYMSTISPIDD